MLRAGPDAVLSHQTAAERQGLLKQPSSLIHISVPEARNPSRHGKIPGVVIHRSDVIVSTRYPGGTLPCTRIEDTVLDLIKVSKSFDAKYNWICLAIGGRLTTAERILDALAKRKRFPARREAELMLGYAAEGILSWLERQWAEGVERQHGFPTARRQVKVRQGTTSKYLDNLYEDYRVCVELDGKAAHPEEERRFDEARDRWNLAHGKVVTMRYQVPDLRDQEHRCEKAAEMAVVLRDHGSAVGGPCEDPRCQERFAEFRIRISESAERSRVPLSRPQSVAIASSGLPFVS
ncbi:MAG: hypothetical protein J2P25_13790 [Nocardiopsaceae bacterium]|nr:hypothetical protein [Nocardiopsaceae bacterium]